MARNEGYRVFIDALIKELSSDEYIEKKIKDILGDDMADGKNKE